MASWVAVAWPLAAVPPDKSPVPPDHAEKLAKGQELFAQQVRKVLLDQCVKCHGGEKSKADFDLTTREGLLRGGNSKKAAVVPFKAKESRLYMFVTHQEKPHMPSQADKLSDAQIAAIEKWIDFGAPYDKPLVDKPNTIAKKPLIVTDEDRNFWSFRPLPRAVELPNVKNEAWCKTPIDRFILAKLEEKAIAPNAAVDRRKLIRRVFFDLIGLPPSPEEIDAFVGDKDPDAYEKLVDKLLDNPHFGERWARHWLDLARFAESHGYEQDYDRPNAYHYRDFVIKAFNQDLPYDTFVKWQLAGDEFEPDNPLALMATGFLAAGTHATQITKNQVEKERYDELDDMSRTTGTAMLGLTVGCARCHDHKYDPIPTKDYYRILSTFTTTVRSDYDINLDPKGYQTAKAMFDADHAKLVEALQKYEKEELPQKLDDWLAKRPKDAKQPTWIVPELVSYKSSGGATLTKLDDGSVLASDKNPDFDTYNFVVHTQLKGITGVRLEALSHESFVKGGPGRAANGNFALSDFRVTAAPLDGKTLAVPVKLCNPRVTFAQKGLPIAAAIDDDPKSAWAVDPQFGKDHAAAFDTEAEVGFDGGTVVTFTLKFENNAGHQIGRTRLALATAPRPAALDGERISEAVLKALAADKPTDEQRGILLAWYGPKDDGWKQLNQKVVDHQKTEPKPHLVKALISSEGVPAVRLHTQGGDFLEQTHYLKRGDPNRKEEVATQSFLQVLMRSPEGEKHWEVAPPAGCRTSYRRRSLANWMTDVESGAGGLLARVIVNRLWQHHMGRGIVGTPSDFGFQGDRPTHPELLDWLARELVANGWRLKPIHKKILMSAVYLENGAFDKKKADADSDNRLFWRHPPHRLEAEIIRDSLLTVSGTLDEKMFGPGTLDLGHRRRSIYFFVKRSQLIPTMVLFDAPDTLQGLEQRVTTTIAPQALLLINSAIVRGYADHFAQRISPAADTGLPDVVRAGYARALGRAPTAEELADSVEFLKAQMDAYQSDGKPDARKLAITDLCQVLMGLNEFVYVD
jgi:mono/diheme cytochrome c family protein